MHCWGQRSCRGQPEVKLLRNALWLPNLVGRTPNQSGIVGAKSHRDQPQIKLPPNLVNAKPMHFAATGALVFNKQWEIDNKLLHFFTKIDHWHRVKYNLHNLCSILCINSALAQCPLFMQRPVFCITRSCGYINKAYFKSVRIHLKILHIQFSVHSS